MTDRIHHSNAPTTVKELSASMAHYAKNPADSGNVLAILTSSNRIVLKNGRLSGGRACALSARAASRTAAHSRGTS
jgi:hypothetical protein